MAGGLACALLRVTHLRKCSVRALMRRVLSVGRLDVNTSGLLLLTNCGQLKQVSSSANTCELPPAHACPATSSPHSITIVTGRRSSSPTTTSTGIPLPSATRNLFFMTQPLQVLPGQHRRHSACFAAASPARRHRSQAPRPVCLPPRLPEHDCRVANAAPAPTHAQRACQ